MESTSVERCDAFASVVLYPFSGAISLYSIATLCTDSEWQNSRM